MPTPDKSIDAGPGPDTADLLSVGRRAGLGAVGVAPAQVLEPARSVLRSRKEAGLAGEMQFTYRNPSRSTDPLARMPTARSLIVGALRYQRQNGAVNWPAKTQPLSGRIGRYAWTDYYSQLELALESMAEMLRESGWKAQVLADTNHLVDRNVAWLAGLGWYGKNSNLLLPGMGSWFVLGSVLTDAPLTSTGPPIDDGCGRCTKCIEGCPTQAIVGPGIVDANRCLAWLAQAGGSFPVEFREALGDRIYGCDDCQEVCPPNRTPESETDSEQTDLELIAEADFESAPWADLAWLLRASDEEILERHGRWYIADRNVDVIRRTALVAIGNAADPTVSSELRAQVLDLLTRYVNHEVDVLRLHAIWAVRRLGLDAQFDLEAIATQAKVNGDPRFSDELSEPVTARFGPSDWTS